jgi:hypothetical protein
MSLEDWLNSGWLVRHKTSRQEISDLLDAADRDMADCQASGLSPDWRLNIAHNAVILCATAALAACGYRASRDAQHYRLIQSLAHTIGASRDLIDQLDAFRKKRNIGGYERAGTISEHEADEMLGSAKQVREAVESWLRANHPNLLGR